MNAPLATAPTVDWARVRADFPLLARQVHGKPLVYFDYANTWQKPASVIEAVDEFYRRHNANVSRAVHTLGSEATDAYEATRDKLARHLNVRGDEIVFTSGTTQAINLVAYSWALPRLKPGDEILVTRDGAPRQHRAVAAGRRSHRREDQGAPISRKASSTSSVHRRDDAGREAARRRARVERARHDQSGRRDLPRGAPARHRTVVDGSQAVPHMPVDIARSAAISTR